MNKFSVYWMALAHLPRWGHAKINNLIVKFYHENKITPEEFFRLSENEWRNFYGLGTKEIEDLNKAKSELSNNAFLAESLINAGYELIPIISSDYSNTLKENLKVAHAPALLYVKGNKQILHEKSIAIVGSRNASENSLKFADNIAKLASIEFKVVVSGFAKGVDKQALDSSIKYMGQSIIVLPQGIATFGSGFNSYYRQIVDGNVLVISTFFPKAPWRAELAMARNPIIYGLADEIYVAESSDKGGTWSGVIDGLRKGRIIYVRKPEPAEKTANGLLIQKGAVAVDFNGIVIPKYSTNLSPEIPLFIKDENTDNEKKILNFLETGEFSVEEILKRLNIDWSEERLREFLKGKKEVRKINRKTTVYTVGQSTLFD